MPEDGPGGAGGLRGGNRRALRSPAPLGAVSTFLCELLSAFPLPTRAGDKKIKSISVTYLLAGSGGDVYYERLCEKGLTIHIKNHPIQGIWKNKLLNMEKY